MQKRLQTYPDLPKRVPIKRAMQILQEQQALLLEDSPAYLAGLSQDDQPSPLREAADAHDWWLDHDQSTIGNALVAWRPDGAHSSSLHHSK